MLDRIRWGVFVGAAVLALAPCLQAASGELPILCLAPVYPPERYVTIKMGYSKDVLPADFDPAGHKYAGWFESAKDRFWELSVPDDFVIWNKKASDRPEVSTDVTFYFLYPEMLPMEEVENEMKHLGRFKFGPVNDKAILPPCERRGPLDPGLMEEARSISIDLRAPVACCRMPIEPERLCTSSRPESAQPAPEMDFDGLRACGIGGVINGVRYYGTLDDQPFALTCPTLANRCTAGFDLWTWPVYVSFANGLLPKWRTIVGAARAFLDAATKSKSDIPGEIK